MDSLALHHHLEEVRVLVRDSSPDPATLFGHLRSALELCARSAKRSVRLPANRIIDLMQAMAEGFQFSSEPELAIAILKRASFLARALGEDRRLRELNHFLGQMRSPRPGFNARGIWRSLAGWSTTN